MAWKNRCAHQCRRLSLLLHERGLKRKNPLLCVRGYALRHLKLFLEAPWSFLWGRLSLRLFSFFLGTIRFQLKMWTSPFLAPQKLEQEIRLNCRSLLQIEAQFLWNCLTLLLNFLQALVRTPTSQLTCRAYADRSVP